MNLQDKVKPYLEYCTYRKELDAKTVKAYRIDLTQFFSYVQSTEPEKETIILPRIIPREEIEQLLNCIYASLSSLSGIQYKHSLRDAAVIEVFFATGARVYEISNIRAENINLNSGLIRIMGKGGKERYIQISNTAVLDILRKYYEENEPEIKKFGYFFINNRGKRYTEQSIRLMLKKYTLKAGIQRKITPHMFRHSFATYLIEEGVDVSCVQQILGHSSIKTTQIYIHVAAKKQADILRELHPRNNMNIVKVA